MNENRTLALIAPAFLVIGVLMVLPLCIAVVYSFMTAIGIGGHKGINHDDT